MPSQITENQAFLFVFIAAVTMAFKGIFAKFAYMAGMDVDALLLLRFGIAAPLFWLGVRIFAKGSSPLNWVQWRVCILAGFMFFCATYSDFTAIKMLGVSVSRLILFTFPVIVMLINSFLARKSPSVQQFTMFAITYFGIALVMAPEGMKSLEAFDWVGAAWGMTSAISYAIYLVISQEMMKTVGSLRFTAASGTVTLILMILAVPFSEGYEGLSFPVEGIFWASMIAVFCTAIPFFLLLEGIRRCGATQASLITLTGPAMTVVLAWLILQETLDDVQMIGGALTILGVASLKSGWVIAGLVKILKRA